MHCVRVRKYFRKLTWLSVYVRTCVCASVYVWTQLKQENAMLRLREQKDVPALPDDHLRNVCPSPFHSPEPAASYHTSHGARQLCFGAVAQEKYGRSGDGGMKGAAGEADWFMSTVKVFNNSCVHAHVLHISVYLSE